MLKRFFPPILLLLVSLVLTLPLFAKERDVITYASEIDYPPFCMVDADGNPYGFSVELLKAALDVMNRDVTFTTGIWTDVREMLEKGEVQALPLVGRTPEREDAFDFTFPYMSLHGAIVVRSDNFTVRELNDLKGKSVAVMAGDNAEEFLRREERGIIIKTTPTFEDAFIMLSEKRCDAVFIQRLVALRLLQDMGLDDLKIVDNPIEEFRQDFCFAVKEGDRETLSLLNEGLSIVIADGTYRFLHSKWFASLELPVDRRIVIGGDHDFPPFEYFDNSGRPQGFNIDLINAVAKETGLEIEIRLGPWPEILKKLEAGEIDAVMGMFYSPERDLKYDFSQAHTLIHNIAAIRKGEGPAPSSYEDLRGKIVIVQAGDIMHDYALKHGVENIVAVGSQEEALRLLSNGVFDTALVSRINALFSIEKNKIKNLELGKTPLISSEYCFAVPSGRKALLAKLSEGLKIIAESGEYHSIHEKWMGIYARDNFSRILRYLGLAALPILAVLFLSLLWSWTLSRKVSERTEELEKSEQKFRSLLEGAPMAIFVHTGFLFSYLNRSACDLFEVSYPSQLTGKHVLDRFQPSVREIAEKEIEAIYLNKKSVPLDERIFLRYDGSEVVAEMTAVPVVFDGKEGGLVFARDITEQKKAEDAYMAAEQARLSLEAQLAQAQKMEAVGRLAGGVAHDFNNMLSVIKGYTELLIETKPKDDPDYALLDEIYRATMRSADVTRQLLAFARKQTIKPVAINLNETVEIMLKTLVRLIGEDIELIWLPSLDVWNVLMDPSQVDQILANFCINARDAIEGVGRITIETQNVSFEKPYSSRNNPIIPGDFVMLSVTDDGCGMDRETTEKIFEPFFTTKKAGEGTGLGLATVYGIIKQNNGFVNVYSEPGRGTTFRVYIPRFTGEAGKIIARKKDKIARSKGETLLLVEDEASILNMLRKMLSRLGYHIIAANKPSDAVSLAENHEGTIDLLITDVVMPEMNGRELAGKITELYPSIKVLYMSGYTANVIAHSGVLDEGVNFIQKPYSIHDVAARIREVLEG